MRLIFAFLMFTLLPSANAVETKGKGQQQHPEARPFAESLDAGATLDSALASAAAENRFVIVILGANWCHDSRALAGWLATPRFAAMMQARYKVVYVDAGTPQTGKGRNLDIAKRFGIKKLKGTPLMIVAAPDGKMLNSRMDAVSWRNAASRSENAIYRYFEHFAAAQK